MIYRGTTAMIKEYEENPAINQSAIKLILSKGMYAFLTGQYTFTEDDELYYEEKKHFILGKGVDVRLTLGDEAFDEQFHTAIMMKKLGPKPMSAVKRTFDDVSSKYASETILPLKYYMEELHKACNAEEYFMNRAKPNAKEDSRVLGLIGDEGDAAKYWQDLKDACGKQVISQEEKEIINGIELSFLNHPNTAKYFQMGESATVDILYQIPLYWEYLGIILKSLPDMVMINHERKIIKGVDIKTIGDSVLNFHKAAKLRRYDIQASFYRTAIESSRKHISNYIGKDVTDYEVAEDFTFLVESTKRWGFPIPFIMGMELLTTGWRGSADGSLYGWMDALVKYKKWEEVDFSIEKMLAPYNGRLEMGSDFNYLLEL
jgi:hypothetical protein